MKDQTRNIRPIAPALVAMSLYNKTYAAQRGGSMDFWDSLSPYQQRTCIELATQIRAASMQEDQSR